MIDKAFDKDEGTWKICDVNDKTTEQRLINTKNILIQKIKIYLAKYTKRLNKYYFKSSGDNVNKLYDVCDV